MAKGIDVYKRFNDVRDWRAVRNSGIEFAWVKLADGPDVRDDGGYVAGARAAGILVGGYSYAQPGDAAAHARVFLGQVAAHGATDLAPALDIEDNENYYIWPRQEAISYSIAFLRAIAAAGHRPCLYANNDMLKSILAPVRAAVPNLLVWAARYGGVPQVAYDVHQYSSSVVVPGIVKPVDGNDGPIPHNTTGGTPPPTQEDDDMPDRELKPTTGKDACVTSVVPRTATHAVVSLGWVQMQVKKLAFFSHTPEKGLTQTQVWPPADKPNAVFPIDPARSWEIAIPAGDQVTVELTYSMPVDPAHDTTGVLGFR